MKISDTCINCGRCVPYCPVDAILKGEKQHEIDYDECVECGICKRYAGCPTDSFYQDEPMSEMRELRKAFSDPLVPHKSTSVPGRGTEEMKTNEVTGRFKRGRVGIALELGRPGTGTRFYDVEKVTKKLAPLGFKFEPLNPVTVLVENHETGELRKDVLKEKVLSAIVEFEVSEKDVATALQAVKEVAGELETVFSLDLCARLEADGSLPAANIARDLGFTPSINGKTNIGLGRPLAEEA